MAAKHDKTSEEPSEELVDDEGLAPEHQALAEELEACIAAYDEYMLADEESDAPMPLEQVEHDAAVARRLLSVLRESPALWRAFDCRADGILEEWMNGLPFDLVEHQRMDDGVSLVTEIDEVCRNWIEGTATAKAAVLIRADRESEARAILEAALAASPEDCVVLEDAAELFEELGEPERVKTLLEKLVALDVYPFNENARERLGLGPKPAPKPVTFVNAAPKVGRNDPCPCGSGKKFKKCCG